MRVRVGSQNIRAGWSVMVLPGLAVVASIAGSVYLAAILGSRLGWAPAVVVVLACWAFFNSPAWMTVDDGGIEIAWMGKRRVIPRATIEDAVVFDFWSNHLQRLESTDPTRAETALTTRRPAHYIGVEVRCRGGEVLRIPTQTMLEGEGAAREKAERAAQRIREFVS
jgi:hypothetical protein